jgi:hypothetical protein
MKVYVFVFQQKTSKEVQGKVFYTMAHLRKVAEPMYRNKEANFFHAISRNLCEKEVKNNFAFNEETNYSFNFLEKVINNLFQSIPQERIEENEELSREYYKYLDKNFNELNNSNKDDYEHEEINWDDDLSNFFED